MENKDFKTPRGMAITIPGKTTTIDHQLGTTDIIVSLYNVATGNELNSGITVVDKNTVTITTASGAPDQIRVVIMGFLME